MDKTSKNVSFQSDSLSVYVRQPQVKLRADWLYFFPQPLSDLLTRLPNSARATLLDIAVLGHTTPSGVIAMPVPALLGWGLSRTKRYDSLQALEQNALLKRKEKGMIYLSPALMYRGRAENYTKAIETWMRLGGE